MKTSIGTDRFSSGKKIYHVPVTLHNNADDTLRYYSMSCSWDEFYRTDNSKAELLGHDCYKNVPREITLLPHTSNTITIPVVCKNSEASATVHLRIGLNLNIKADNRFYTEYDDELYRYNIVWSNEIMLNTN